MFYLKFLCSENVFSSSSWLIYQLSFTLCPHPADETGSNAGENLCVTISQGPCQGDEEKNVHVTKY